MTARELCLECLATIEAAREAVAEGAVLDLTGFDAEIERLCVSAALLPPEERVATAQELRRLSEELDRLATALKEQHSRLREGAERATPGRAAQAYRQTRGEPG